MSRGFSLIEVVLCCALTSIGSLVVFALFQSGWRTHQRISARQGLEGDARRVLGRLELDLRRAALDKTRFCRKVDTPGRVYTDPAGALHPREAVCLPALQDWKAASSYDADAQPLWDRYISIYATRQPVGQLVRQLYCPPTPPYAGSWNGWDPATYLDDTPSANPAPIGTEVLASSVDSFEVEPDQAHACCSFNLICFTPDRRSRMQWQSVVELENTQHL